MADLPLRILQHNEAGLGLGKGGAGKDVSHETIAGAGAPLRINRSSGSFINVPIRQ
jgi:hypothetical protein